MPEANPLENPNMKATRDVLKNQFGIDDTAIGWNPSTGYVQLYGKDTFKPETMVGDRTYLTDAEISSYGGAIQQAKQQNDLLQQVVNPQGQVNPYDNQITQLIGQIQTQMQPSQTNVYGTPEFAAAQAQVQREAQQGIRQSQESLGGSGFARSTQVSDRAQSIQNDASNYLQTQLVPQIQNSIRAREQQQLGNLMSLLGVLGQQQTTMDTRQQNQLSNAAGVLEFLTGRQDRAEDVAYRGKRDDRNDFVEDRNFTFQTEQAQLAQKNLEEEKVYRAQQDTEENRRWWAEYNRAGEQFAANQGLQWAQLNEQQKNRIADEAYRQETLKLQKAESQFNQGLQMYKETGNMPAYMADLGFNVSGLNNAKTKAEVEGLYSEISSGALRPEDALKRIEDARKMGLKDPEVLDELQKTVYMVEPSLDPNAPPKPGFWERMKTKYKNFVDTMNNFSGPESRQ